jgi:hypothetical protein
MYKYLPTLGLFFLPFLTFAQGTNTPLTNEDAYHIFDRIEITSGARAPYHSSLKPYNRGTTTAYALSIDTTNLLTNPSDLRDLQYLYDDSNEYIGQGEFANGLGGAKEPTLGTDSKLVANRYTINKNPLFGHFYKTPANLFESDSKYFHIKVNPIFQLGLAKEKNDEEYIFINQRGLEMRGTIDDRLYFYTNIVESQARFANYVTQTIETSKAVPGNGFYKSYNSSLFKVQNGYDFLNSQAYIGFNATKHIGIQFGYAKNFIGDGYRSMFLSDFSDNYLHLKINTNIGRFQYQNIFAELKALSTAYNVNNIELPKKYVAMHHLSARITDNFNVGIFEAVVFKRNQQFELGYLNPVILYRTVEGSIGSPDNELIGLDFKYNFLKRFSLYGQANFDEFLLSELIHPSRGWWANKYAMQLGLKYINVLGIDHLDGQIEYNVIRPYTFSHFDSITNYSHNLQPLAHPLGSNLQELVLLLRYKPTKLWTINAKLINSTVGDDKYGSDWGGNIFIPYSERSVDYGSKVGQGIQANILLTSLDVSYRMYHNMFLDFHFFARKKTSDDLLLSQSTLYVGGGIRINTGNLKFDF